MTPCLESEAGVSAQVPAASAHVTCVKIQEILFLNPFCRYRHIPCDMVTILQGDSTPGWRYGQAEGLLDAQIFTQSIN